MKEPPFKPAVEYINIGLSLTGIQHAIAEWFKKYETYPSVLHVSPELILSAEKVVEYSIANGIVSRLNIVPHTEFETYWWSVGTSQDYGYGSTGA